MLVCVACTCCMFLIAHVHMCGFVSMNERSCVQEGKRERERERGGGGDECISKCNQTFACTCVCMRACLSSLPVCVDNYLHVYEIPTKSKEGEDLYILLLGPMDDECTAD